MKDNINPDHYKQGGIECIVACDAAVVNKNPIEAYHVKDIIKYLWRYEAKNGSEDIKKAQWYLERLLLKVEEREALEADTKLSKKVEENFNNEMDSLYVNTAYNSNEIWKIEEERAPSILKGRHESIKFNEHYNFINRNYKNTYIPLEIKDGSIRMIEKETGAILFELIEDFYKKYIWKEKGDN